MSYTEMARDVLAFMNNTLQEREVVLIGHSMGGKVAQCLSLMHPDRIAGLVVLDIAPVRYRASGGEGWRTIEEIVHSVASIDLGSSSGGGGRGVYKTKRDVDVTLRQCTSTLEDPALRAFVLTNLEQVPPARATMNEGGGTLTRTCHCNQHCDGRYIGMGL